MNRNRVIAGQAGFSFAGFLFGQTVRFGYNLLVARLLGAEALGTYALAIGVIQIAEVFAVAGLDSGLLRFVNVHRRDPLRQREVIGSALKTSFLISLSVLFLLLLFSGRIATVLHGSRLLQLTLCCYGAAIPFNVTTTLFGHAMQGFRNLRPKIVATQIVSPLLLLCLTLLFRFTAGREEALLLPFAMASAGGFFWIRRSLAGVTGVRSADILHAGTERAMLTYALPFLVVSLLSMMTQWLDIMMLGMFTDTATVGLYHPAARTAGVIRSVLLAFSGIAAPMIAELHIGRQNAEIGRIFRMVTRWIIAVVTPPVVLFMLLPESVLGMFGSRFTAAGTALVLLTGASFLQAGFGLSSTVLAMTGYSRLSLFNAFGALGLQILLNLFLIPRMGITGAALSNLLVFLVLSLLRLLQIYSFMKIHPFGRALWKPLVAGLAAALLLFALRPWLLTLPAFSTLLLAVLLVGGSYTGMLLLLKLEPDEREIILRAIPFINRKTGRERL